MDEGGDFLSSLLTTRYSPFATRHPPLRRLERRHRGADRGGHRAQLQMSVLAGNRLSVDLLKIFGKMSLLRAIGLDPGIALRRLFPDFHPQIRQSNEHSDFHFGDLVTNLEGG